MFDQVDYLVTNEIMDKLSVAIQNLLWLMSSNRETGNEALQTFMLLPDGNQQQIIHTRAEPLYGNQIVLPSPSPIAAKIYVINTEDCHVMMFAHEYQGEEK